MEQNLPVRQDNIALHMKRVSFWLALFINAGAAAVLFIGWGLDVEAVRRINPSFAAMVPSTAMLFLIASALAIWFSAAKGKVSGAVTMVAALVIGAVAFADIAVILSGAANGIDLYLAPSVAALQRASMATATATNFLLFAAALVFLILNRKWSDFFFVTAATAGLVLCSAAVVGYAFDASALYSVAPFTAMALHTALGFVLLFAAILLMRHDIGWVGIIAGEGGGSAGARLLLPGAVLLPLVLCYIALEFTTVGAVSANFRLSLLATVMMLLLSASVIWYARIQNRIEKKLRTAIADRDLLLREVYHRVKNNLQMTTALLTTGAIRVKDKEAQNLLQGTTRRIEALGTVHRLLISSHSPSEVSAKSFLEDLCQNIFSGQQDGGENIKLDLDADSAEIDIDLAVSLGLIVNELVTNALKYAFIGRESGVVTVRYRAEPEGGASLTVADDGIGAEGLYESEGRDGAGARIVQGLVRQLQAEMIVASRQGVVVVINIPAEYFKGSSK